MYQTNNLTAKPVDGDETTFDIYKDNVRIAQLYADVKEYCILDAGQLLTDTVLKEMLKICNELYIEQ